MNAAFIFGWKNSELQQHHLLFYCSWIFLKAYHRANYYLQKHTCKKVSNVFQSQQRCWVLFPLNCTIFLFFKHSSSSLLSKMRNWCNIKMLAKNISKFSFKMADVNIKLIKTPKTATQPEMTRSDQSSKTAITILMKFNLRYYTKQFCFAW